MIESTFHLLSRLGRGWRLASKDKFQIFLFVISSMGSFHEITNKKIWNFIHVSWDFLPRIIVNWMVRVFVTQKIHVSHSRVKQLFSRITNAKFWHFHVSDRWYCLCKITFHNHELVLVCTTFQMQKSCCSTNEFTDWEVS